MPSDGDDPASVDSLLTPAAEKLRDSAKWIIAAFGAIGAALATGIQFSSLGSLSGHDLEEALAGAGLVFLGMAVTIFSVADILAPRGRTLSDLASAPVGDPAQAFFKENPELLQAFSSVDELRTAFDRDYHLYRDAFRAWHAQPNPDQARTLKVAKMIGAATEEIATNVISWANYQTLQADYRKMIYRRALPGLVLIATGLVLFVFKVSQPQSSPPSSLVGVNLQNSTLTGAQLSGAELKNANLQGADLRQADLADADLSGAELNRADLTGANLQGATLTGATLTHVHWSHTTCPDGALSDQSDHSCIGHLSTS